MIQSSKPETQCVCVGLLRTAQGRPDPSISSWVGQACDMAVQAKNTREARKEELLTCIEEANDALGEAKDKKMRTNVLRTLQTRERRLRDSFDEWNRACSDYTTKVTFTILPDDKKTDVEENVKPVRKSFIETSDLLNDMIEEKLSQENNVITSSARKGELEMQIERECKDIDTKIKHHLTRTCSAELSRGAKDRLYKELDRDVIEPIETVRKLFLELFAITTGKTDKDALSSQEESWMDSNTRSIMSISDKYTSIPEINAPDGGVNLDVSATSQNPARASLKVKKADPPRFDGRIPSFPRFKKDWAGLMMIPHKCTISGTV